MKGLTQGIVILMLCGLSQTALSETMTGMFYCTETAAVGIIDGRPKTFTSEKFTIKVKDGIVTISGTSPVSHTFDLVSNIINHDRGWVYVRKSIYDVLSIEKADQAYRFVLTTRFKLGEGINTASYHLMSEGTCEK